MLQTVGSWVGGILLVVNIGGLIILNVIRLIKIIQCRKIRNGCDNMKCINRYCCSKYDNRQEILNLRIEMLKSQVEKKKNDAIGDSL